MPGKIFISYRREDVAGDARGIRDALAAKFGRGNVFMDVDDLLVGQRFDVELAKALDACDVLVAVIGRHWMDLLKAKTASGERDYVRAEIGAALEREIVVIPVRVGQEGRMPPLPREDELPEDIRALVLYQKHDLAHERFGRDVTDLTKAIESIIAIEAAHAIEALMRIEELQPGEHRVERWRSFVHEARSLLGVILFAGAAVLILALLAVSGVLDGANAPPAPGTGKTEWFRDCTTCPEMVVVPAGSFIMGSADDDHGKGLDGTGYEKPQRRVTIVLPFAVGRFAVTFDEWDACVAAGGCNGYRPSDAGWGRGRRPVINVSWDDAKAYVAWLSRATGKRYRLPSEAEREYVTRAGTTTRYWWGSSISTNQTNYDGRYDGGVFRQKTLPVNSFAPNPWGLYQVHGNVYEWTEDCWNKDYKGAPTDGSTWLAGDCGVRVLRGGFWYANWGLRAASRVSGATYVRHDYIGFRVVRTLSIEGKSGSSG